LCPLDGQALIESGWCVCVCAEELKKKMAKKGPNKRKTHCSSFGNFTNKQVSKF